LKFSERLEGRTRRGRIKNKTLREEMGIQNFLAELEKKRQQFSGHVK
jgi:hypothetical protein